MLLPSPRRVKSSAFTLIEILAAMAIIGVLAALVFSASNSAKQSSAAAKALSNTKQLFLASLQFSQDNDGQLLGWGRAKNWNDDVFLMRNLNLYLTGENVTGMGPAALDKIGKGLQPFVDPLVPEKFNKYSNRFPYTFSINSIFNRFQGRGFQGIGDWPGPAGANNPRRMVEFEKPSQTIYAVSGGYQFTTAFASNPSLVEEPVGRQAIFYYYGGNKSTPAVFLDGHAELLPFPIPVAMIIPGAE